MITSELFLGSLHLADKTGINALKPIACEINNAYIFLDFINIPINKLIKYKKMSKISLFMTLK